MASGNSAGKLVHPAATACNAYFITQKQGGIPRHFWIAAWVWFLSVSLFYLFVGGQYVSQLFMLVALFCYATLLLRPLRESPFALLLLATGPSDMLIFIGPLLFFGRAFLAKRVYVPTTRYGYMFLVLLLVISLSTVSSYITVEFRPLQTFFWCVTFLMPLAIICLGFRINASPESVARYAIFLILMELIPILTQVPAYLSSGSPDVITGTWMSSNFVGFWGSALMMGSLAWFVRAKRPSFWVAAGLMGAGLFMTLLASGKAYSGMVVIAASGVLFIFSIFIQRVLNGRPWPVFFFFFFIVSAGLVFVQAFHSSATIYSWAKFQIEHSQKLVFLDRVFFEMGDYGYSDSLGVGPGMLGSRAANSVASSDVLFREVKLPAILVDTTSPELAMMKGLYNQDFVESIKFMSATLVFPFSGVAAMKGELGWIGLLLIILLLLFRFWPKDSVYLFSPSISIVYFMSACAGIAIVGLAVFDTVWEMPKIMVFLGAMMLGMSRSFRHG